MSDSDEEVTNKLQVYTLVRFTHRGRKKQVESIDIVPSKWLDFDSHRGRCVTKYMNPPYNEEDLELIQSLTINNVNAPEDWPVFPVELKGRAETYDEALRKIKRLEQEEHVLTLESEDSASEIQKQLTLDIKRKKLLAEAKKLKAKVSDISVSTTYHADSHRFQTNENRYDIRKDSTVTNKTKKKSTKAPIEKANTLSSQPPLTTSDDGTAKETSDVILKNSEENNLIFNLEPSLSTLKEYTLNVSGSMNDIFTLEPDDPLIHVTNIDKTDFEARVLNHLVQLSNVITSIKDKQDEMAKEIASIKNTQAAISNFLLDKKITSKSSIDLGVKYNFAMPIASYEDFILFENKLKSEKYFKNDVYLELRSLMDKDYVITKSITNMLKKFLTKEVAGTFTAIRSSSINKNKQKFKPTQFCSLIYGTITKLRSERAVTTGSDDLDTALTDVLSNVNKWKI